MAKFARARGARNTLLQQVCVGEGVRKQTQNTPCSLPTAVRAAHFHLAATDRSERFHGEGPVIFLEDHPRLSVPQGTIKSNPARCFGGDHQTRLRDVGHPYVVGGL